MSIIAGVLQVQALKPLVNQAIEASHPYGAERGVKLLTTAMIEDANVKVDGERLIFESEEGKGATFFFDFPVHAAA